MTAALPLPLRHWCRSAGICSDHRLVPLRWFGVLKERQHEGRVIRGGRARTPIVGRGARQAEGDEIGGLDRDGGKRLVKHGSTYHQRKIRQSERCSCNSPTIGHNGSTMKHTAESIAALPVAEILPALAAHWEQATGEGMRYWQDTDTHFEIRRDLRDIAAMETEIAQRKAEIVSNAQTLLARMDKEVAA